MESPFERGDRSRPSHPCSRSCKKILITVYIAKFPIICYNTTAATLSSRKEVYLLEYLIAFIISVVAGVVSYYICKWLDGDDT